MKKILCLVVVVSASLLFSACSQNKQEENNLKANTVQKKFINKNISVKKESISKDKSDKFKESLLKTWNANNQTDISLNVNKSNVKMQQKDTEKRELWYDKTKKYLNNDISSDFNPSRKLVKENSKLSNNFTGLQSSNSEESKKMIQEIEQINQISQKPWFDSINCKKQYSTTWAIRLCQEKQLWFEELFCYTSKIDEPIKKIINKNKFDLVSQEKITQAIDNCKKQRELVKEDKKQQQEIKNKIKNFKLSDCKDYIKQKYPALKDEKEIKKLVKQCKIWFALNYARTCDVLSWNLKKECEIAKEYIDKYNLMQKYVHEYGNFRLSF